VYCLCFDALKVGWLLVFIMLQAVSNSSEISCPSGSYQLAALVGVEIAVCEPGVCTPTFIWNIYVSIDVQPGG
jgi:hypothetical protein